MRTKPVIFLLVLSVCAAVFFFEARDTGLLDDFGSSGIGGIHGIVLIGKQEDQGPRLLLTDYSEMVNIPINPMMEFDFLSKSEIYKIREKFVFKHPELVSNKYMPSKRVWGEIVDNKPWWGIYGIYYFGDGNKSIEGMSAESRFVANPYLLIALSETNAYRIDEYVKTPVTNHPRLKSLVWIGVERFANATYDVKKYFANYARYRYPIHSRGEFLLDGLNARDFGFSFVYPVFSKSKAVRFKHPIPEVIELKDYIHSGNSCGYSGGCNNSSPFTQELVVVIESLPASLYLNLWIERPVNPSQKPDWSFLLDLR